MYDEDESESQHVLRVGEKRVLACKINKKCIKREKERRMTSPEWIRGVEAQVVDDWTRWHQLPIYITSHLGIQTNIRRLTGRTQSIHILRQQ